jgi:hypothetical protein
MAPDPVRQITAHVIACDQCMAVGRRIWELQAPYAGTPVNLVPQSALDALVELERGLCPIGRRIRGVKEDA